MPHLIEPATHLQHAWLAARDEWGRGTHQPGSGLRPTDDIDTTTGFTRWVTRLHHEADETRPPAPGLVHARYWWITEPDGIVLGAISLRYTLTDFLLRAGGHIGYSVRPSARGRGIARWALTEVLTVAGRRGINPVLVTCDDDNHASARVIEKCGGVLEDIRHTEIGHKRRYWITST